MYFIGYSVTKKHFGFWLLFLLRGTSIVPVQLFFHQKLLEQCRLQSS